MDEESKFNGFLDPSENWSKLPHQLIDALPLFPGSAKLKVVLYILRHTWGYHETEGKRMTIDEICNGRKRRNGTRIDNGTGLSEQGARNGLVDAERDGFIVIEIDNTDLARIKKYYSLSNQGYKLLTPEVQTFDPQTPKTLPRTEKDTKETHLEVESPTPLQLVTTCHEKNIGLVVESIVKGTARCIGMIEALEEFPFEWIIEAIELTPIRTPKRSWGYAVGILNKWKTEGRDTPAPNGNGHAAPAPDCPQCHGKGFIETPNGMIACKHEKELA